MKTSNIIIVAFATFVLGGMLIKYVDAKQHKTIKAEDNFTEKEYPLPAFSVVVAEVGSDLHLDQSDSRLIKVQYDKRKKTPTKLYVVKNDTLHIYKGLRMFVKCKNLTSFIGNKPFWVGVDNFNSDSMTIKMNGGEVFLTYDKHKGSKKFANMSIIANDSAKVHINDIPLRNLSVKSNNAKVTIYCSAKFANVTLTNSATVSGLININNITVQKDSTCRLTLDNQHVEQ